MMAPLRAGGVGAGADAAARSARLRIWRSVAAMDDGRGYRPPFAWPGRNPANYGFACQSRRAPSSPLAFGDVTLSNGFDRFLLPPQRAPHPPRGDPGDA